MENGFAAAQHKFCYPNQLDKTDRGAERAPKLPKKEKAGVEKEVCHKSIWRSFNIFAKIKKSNRGRCKEAAETIEKELTTIDNSNLEKCKTKEMDDDKLNKIDCNDNLEEDNVSVESKSSFFGKMNLESLLKIFVDLHKKKQLNQNSAISSEPITNIQAHTVAKSKGSESVLDDSRPPASVIESDTFSLKEPEQLQNPVNSPSLMNTRLKNDASQHCSTQSDPVCDTDSTLSLLNNVSIKLKDYLESEAKDNQDEAEPIVAQNDAVNEIQKEAPEHQGKIGENRQSDSTKDSGDKKMAYTIVETDIKRMIKELLEESKDLKNSIVATGVEEEPTVSFTQLSKSYDSFFVCRSLCNDLINMACNPNAYTLKNRKHLNVTFRQDNEKYVESILTTLVENVLNRKCPQQQLCVNFCLVQTGFKNKCKKGNPDSAMVKFRESSVYILTKKLRKLQPGSIVYPPKVTVHNLSATRRIKLVPSENSLINRIRRSAALLMALYDEMRDYSYYSCTSNILCDLYGSMIKQGLISLTNLKCERSIENVPTPEDHQTQSPRSSELVSTTSNYIGNPTTSSYSNASNITEITTTSNDSSSSESEDDTYTANKRDMLPNLKYTYQSDEEINSPEEIKWIDENVSKNGACKDMNVEDVERLENDSASDKYPYVSINEDEAFLKK